MIRESGREVIFHMLQQRQKSLRVAFDLESDGCGLDEQEPNDVPGELAAYTRLRRKGQQG